MCGLRRTVRRLRAMTWLRILVTVIIIVALVGHVAIVINAANSLEVERARVISVAHVVKQKIGAGFVKPAD